MTDDVPTLFPLKVIPDPARFRVRWITSFWDGLCRYRKIRYDYKLRREQLRKAHEHHWRREFDREHQIIGMDGKSVIGRQQKAVCCCVGCGEWRKFDI